MLIWIYFNSNAYAECVTLQSDDGIDRTTGNGCIDMTDENHGKTEENEIPTIIGYSKKPTEAVSSRTTKKWIETKSKCVQCNRFSATIIV